MPKTDHDARLAECRRAGRVCEVRSCDLPADRWGRLCAAHDKREEQTGHPKGRTIRVAELQPFIGAARSYLQKNRDHPAIALALRFLYDLIYGPRRRVEHLPRNATPEDRIGRWLDKMQAQEVHELDALARVVAIYCHREAFPQDFENDRHFRHQLVIRFLRMVRAPRKKRWGSGRAVYRYDRVTVAVREQLGDRLERSLGRLCLQLARMLTKHLGFTPQPI